MSIALLGVMAMQYYFIHQTYHQKSLLFDESVNASLSAVAGRLERREVLKYAELQQEASLIKHQIEQEKQKNLSEQLRMQRQIEEYRMLQYEHEQEFKKAENQLKEIYPNSTRINNSFYETYIGQPRFRNLVGAKIIESMREDGLIENYVEIYAKEEVARMEPKDDSVRYVIVHLDPIFKQPSTYSIETLSPERDKELDQKIEELEAQLKRNMAKNVIEHIGSIGGKRTDLMEDMALTFELSKRPLRDRVDVDYLEQEIIDELSRRNIQAPFNLEVRSPNKVIYTISTKPQTNKNSKIHTYTTELFQGDLGSAPGMLTIHFPNKRMIIADNMSYLFLPMAALLILLIGSYAYTLSIIFKQKKISEMKTDFINNMTHEFKTPVATIMIASESLKDEEIAQDKNRVERLANIIYDENVRLGNHIERVLNIAKLEKQNLKINKEPIEINALVKGVLESMQLQLQKADGQFHLALNATNDTIIGDELHLSNVLFNLVDNAIKYSSKAPNITVSTSNQKNGIHIMVRDKGIGMSKDQSERIFDQFYRIPTGNIHNVKGFGLGLSYVQDIIKQLNGTIHVKSEKNKGTQFDIWLPQKS